jgi:hypothetical protein
VDTVAGSAVGGGSQKWHRLGKGRAPSKNEIGIVVELVMWLDRSASSRSLTKFLCVNQCVKKFPKLAIAHPEMANLPDIGVARKI